MILKCDKNEDFKGIKKIKLRVWKFIDIIRYNTNDIYISNTVLFYSEQDVLR